MATARRKKLPKRSSVPTSFGKAHLFFLLGVIGVVLMIASNVYLTYEKWKYSFFTPTAIVTTQNSIPTNIYIPNIGLSLPIDEGKITNGRWEVSPRNATHLDQSAVPGDNGNIVLYGHNKAKIFGRLHDLQAGDGIVITTQNGKVHYYQVTEKLVVPPTRVDLVSPTDQEVLTLYTCTGFLDTQRLVIKAKTITREIVF